MRLAPSLKREGILAAGLTKMGRNLGSVSPGCLELFEGLSVRQRYDRLVLF